MERTLVLNNSYEPLGVVPWQRAVTLLFLGKVEMVERHDREIRTPSTRYPRPSVVRLVRFVTRRWAYARFNRDAVYARDRHICQYCGLQKPPGLLTLDHVVPRSQGGRSEWENVVTACCTCNGRKADRTPPEAGMRLAKPPTRPVRVPAVLLALEGKPAPDNWRSYLYL